MSFARCQALHIIIISAAVISLRSDIFNHFMIIASMTKVYKSIL